MWRKMFFASKALALRRSALGLSSVALTAAALQAHGSWGSTVYCDAAPAGTDNDATQKQPAQNTQPKAPPRKPYTTTSLGESGEYLAVFLDQNSVLRIQEQFKAKFSAKPLAHHVTLHFNPSEEELEEYIELLGKRAQIKIVGFAEDENAQAAIATIESKEIRDLCKNDIPHVTISVSKEDPIYSEYYSNLLFQRIQTQSGVRIDDLAQNPEKYSTSSSTELQSFTVWSGTLKADERYKETKAQLQTVPEPLELDGTVCLARQYDPTERACHPDEPTNCGFCIFMRGGPCANTFRQWERCLSKSKEDGSDYIKQCGRQTLELKECCDRNPEYYSDITGGDDDEEGKNEEEDIMSEKNEKEAKQESVSEKQTKEKSDNVVSTASSDTDIEQAA